MTTTNPRPRTLCRLALSAGLVVSSALVAGCKSKDGGSPVAKIRDPLVYGPNRIPPQNVPVPDRDGVGSKGTADPLIGSPTAASGDKNGVGYSDDPERFKGTYIPSESSTPAALAGGCGTATN